MTDAHDDREWLVALRDEIARMADATEVQRTAYLDLIERMDALRGDLDRTSDALARATDEIARIHASRAWRLTRRLSRCGRPLAIPVTEPPVEAIGQLPAAHPLPGDSPGTWPSIDIPDDPLHEPTVSIVVPTKDRADLLAPLLETLRGTDWPDIELVLVDNGTTDAEARALIELADATVISHDAAFNFPHLIEAGVTATRGEVIVLLNNDVEVLAANWLRALVACLDAPDCGIAGGLLLYPDGAIQHAGLVIDGTQPVHALAGIPLAAAPAGAVSAPRPCMAVTGACMALRRETWDSLGGMDPLFARNYNDVDLCLRARAADLTTVFTPRARLLHKESATRGTEWDPQIAAEGVLFRARWAGTLGGGDPFWPRTVDPTTGGAAEA